MVCPLTELKHTMMCSFKKELTMSEQRVCYSLMVSYNKEHTIV